MHALHIKYMNKMKHRVEMKKKKTNQLNLLNRITTMGLHEKWLPIKGKLQSYTTISWLWNILKSQKNTHTHAVTFILQQRNEFCWKKESGIYQLSETHAAGTQFLIIFHHSVGNDRGQIILWIGCKHIVSVSAHVALILIGLLVFHCGAHSVCVAWK